MLVNLKDLNILGSARNSIQEQGGAGERSGPRGQRLFRQESAAGARGMHARDTASAGPPNLWNFLLSLSELVPREPGPVRPATK